MQTLADLKATLSASGAVPHQLAREIAPAIVEHHGEVFGEMSTHVLRTEQVAAILVKRGPNIGITELHHEVWEGFARAYDLEIDVVLSETPATIRDLINLRTAHLALHRAEERRRQAEATIERNQRRIDELTAVLPDELTRRTLRS